VVARQAEVRSCAEQRRSGLRLALIASVPGTDLDALVGARADSDLAGRPALRAKRATEIEKIADTP